MPKPVTNEGDSEKVKEEKKEILAEIENRLEYIKYRADTSGYERQTKCQTLAESFAQIQANVEVKGSGLFFSGEFKGATKHSAFEKNGLK